MFGATLAANDRRLAEARLTITGPCETGGFVNALPMLHSRWMPAIDPCGRRRARGARDDAFARRRARAGLHRRRRAHAASMRPGRSSRRSDPWRRSPATGARSARRSPAASVLRPDDGVRCLRVMRLLRFRHGDRIATGAIDAGERHDPGAEGHVLRGSPARPARRSPLADVRLLAPVLPSKLVVRREELRGPRGRVRDGRCRRSRCCS